MNRIPYMHKVGSSRDVYGLLDPFKPISAEYDKLYGGGSAVAAPTISSFTPTVAAQGQSVVITGTNLTGATIVTFGGTNAASFVVDSATQITAVVGAGTTGSVAVTTPGGTVSLAGFTYIDLNTGLVNAWKMNEATSATRVDLVAGAANLTNNNNCSQVAGIAGNATGFVGASSQYLSKSPYTSLDAATKATFSFWAKSTNAGETTACFGQIKDANNRFFMFRHSDNNLYCTCADGTAQYGVKALTGTAWHHIVLVFDGTQATNATRLVLYLDGVATAFDGFSGTIPAALPTFGTPFEVGRNSVLSTYVNGIMDAGLVYVGRALAQAQVTQLYNAGVPLEYQGSGNWATAS